MGEDPGRLPSLTYLFNEFWQSEEAQQMLRERREWEGRPLYQKGEYEAHAVDHSDIVQGQHGNCFLIAAMAALVQQHPNPDEWMKKVIKDNGDGTYTVTFWDKVGAHVGPNLEMVPARYAPREVTVSGELIDPAKSDDGGEKWPAIIESAYAKAYGGPGEKPFNTRGNLNEPMERLTGLPSTKIDPTQLSIDQLDRYVSNNYAVTVGTFDKPALGLPHEVPMTHPLYAKEGLVDSNPHMRQSPVRSYEHNEQLRPGHEYYVRGVDRASGTVIVSNVWDKGREDIRIPFNQFQTGFEHARLNPVHARPDTP